MCRFFVIRIKRCFLVYLPHRPHRLFDASSMRTYLLEMGGKLRCATLLCAWFYGNTAHLLRATRMWKYPWSIFNRIELWSGGINEHKSSVLLGTSFFLRLPPCCWLLLLNNLFSFAHTHTRIRVVITFSQMLINYDSITVRVESKTAFHPLSNEFWSPTEVTHSADCVCECYTA